LCFQVLMLRGREKDGVDGDSGWQVGFKVLFGL
jgi:hypothetical protein